MIFYSIALRGLTCSFLLLFISSSFFAQKITDPITEPEKKLIIEKSLSLLRDHYIFSSIVDSVSQELTERHLNGAYSKMNNIESFLKELNNDLETLTNDRHVNIFFDPVRVKQIKLESESESGKKAYEPEFLNRARFENYMVRKVERLEGNVGYIKLDMFVDIEIAKPTLVSAMNFISNSSALIIDLRTNGGGHASTVNFLINYFVPDSTLTCHFESRQSDTSIPIYTAYDEQIKKIPDDVPLYILVSNRTSSAAEAFAYTLQAFRRGIIVGDTTNGEANPGYAFEINDQMFLMVPTTFNRNVITNTNWQGVGVIPDITIAQEKSNFAAQASAYKKLSAKADHPEVKNMYEWLIPQFQAKAYPINHDITQLQSLVGNYADNRKILVERDVLYYERTGISEKKQLHPIDENLFELEGSPFFRVRFIKDEDGRVEALEGLYDDGFSEVSSLLN